MEVIDTYTEMFAHVPIRNRGNSIHPAIDERSFKFLQWAMHFEHFNPPVVVFTNNKYNEKADVANGFVALSRDWVLPELVGSTLGKGTLLALLTIPARSLPVSKRERILLSLQQTVKTGSGKNREAKFEPEIFGEVYDKLNEGDTSFSYPALSRIRSFIPKFLQVLGNSSNYIELRQEVGTDRVWAVVHYHPWFLAKYVHKFYADKREDINKRVKGEKPIGFWFNSALGMAYLREVALLNTLSTQLRGYLLLALLRVIRETQSVEIATNFDYLSTNVAKIADKGILHRVGAIKMRMEAPLPLFTNGGDAMFLYNPNVDNIQAWSEVHGCFPSGTGEREAQEREPAPREFERIHKTISTMYHPESKRLPSYYNRAETVEHMMRKYIMDGRRVLFPLLNFRDING